MCVFLYFSSCPKKLQLLSFLARVCPLTHCLIFSNADRVEAYTLQLTTLCPECTGDTTISLTSTQTIYKAPSLASASGSVVTGAPLDAACCFVLQDTIEARYFPRMSLTLLERWSKAYWLKILLQQHGMA